MEPCPDGKCKVQRVNGRIQPTKKGSSVNFYNFVIGTPSLVAKMLHLESADLSPSGKPRGGRFKRGAGAAKLVLSKADQRRGLLGKLIAMIAGLLNVQWREPKRQGSMPTLTLSYFVLTMDKAGHICWPTKFNVNARALLRKLARRELNLMLQDPLYPIDPCMQLAMTQQGESYLDLAGVRAAAEARKAELVAERARLRAARSSAAGRAADN